MRGSTHRRKSEKQKHEKRVPQTVARMLLRRTSRNFFFFLPPFRKTLRAVLSSVSRFFLLKRTRNGCSCVEIVWCRRRLFEGEEKKCATHVRIK
ncbi:hypothetical protein CEXT_767871 [Caerostris extrusa]|uniref:Transmembrane protein n=1 Tax=Caerostris extrusa TaxID=172846 RepID=A0AAV4SKI6_CAEEX|nr:hypothetical protein CEXT_767871 [Caerostris extrusa]